MRKRVLVLCLILALAAALLTGCGQKEETTQQTVRIGSLKGPTSMGLVSLMDQADQQTAKQSYEFTMVTAADELLTKIINNELDIALVPANVAGVLYNKTKGAISVLNINTLGVLYMVSSDSTIQSVADLKGKTIYLTGKGQTPDYTLQYILRENGIQDGEVTLEYKSEALEVAAVLRETEGAVGLLPQPFVTVALGQNQSLGIVLDMTEEWDKVQGEGGSSLVTGVTIVRKEFLQEQEGAVDTFLKEYEASAEFTNTHTAEAAVLIEARGIVAKAAIAEKAIPYCNITFLAGEEMKAALSGYLQVLFDQNPQSMGGSLPGEDFYRIRD